MKRVLILAAVAALGALPSAAMAQTVGPDAFGYTITRSTGVPYVSINTTGTKISTNAGATNNDDYCYSVALPFAFPFYGGSFTNVSITSNGHIAFGSTYTQAGGVNYNNITLNATQTATGNINTTPTLFPYWDDLEFFGATPGQALYTQQTAANQFTIEWFQVGYFNDPTLNTLTFKVVLNSNGTIRIDYLDAGGPLIGTDNHTGGTSATVGIRDNVGNTNGRFAQWGFGNGTVIAGNGVAGGDSLTIAVPEPGTLALCGLAIGSAALKLRRRKAVVA